MVHRFTGKGHLEGGEGVVPSRHKILLRQMQHRLLPLLGHGRGGFICQLPCAGSCEVDEEGAIHSVFFVHNEDVVKLDVPVSHTEFVEVSSYLEHGSRELQPAVRVQTRQVEDVTVVRGNAACVGQPYCTHPESVVDGGAAAGWAAWMAETHQHAQSTLTESTLTRSGVCVEHGNDPLNVPKSVSNDCLTDDGQS